MKKIIIPIAFFLVFLLIGFWYFFPILKPFPSLTGSYSVGTTSLHFIDQQRNEKYSSDPSVKRAVMVRIWYPSFEKRGKKYSYLGNKLPIMQNMFAQKFNIPLFISKMLWSTIDTHTVIDVPLPDKPKLFPVILFSHGLLGLPSDMYVAIIQNLANHGYIVVGIDHPYFNLITQFPDGKVISSYALSIAFQKMAPKEQKAFQTEAIDIYKDDIALVIQELERLNNNPESMFYQRLDLNRIGIMGHSAGGTAAIEFCRNNKRCKIAIDLDGWYDHIIDRQPIEQPLLLLFGSKSIKVEEPTKEYLEKKELTREQYFEREKDITKHRKQLCSAPNCRMVVIPGAEHGDFGDAPLLKWPFRSWYAADSYQILEKINNQILLFCNRYLKTNKIK